MSVEYTEEDWQAWLAENPWDEELREVIEGTVGFHWFILHQRAVELGGAVLIEAERLRDRFHRQREELVRRYFSS